MLANYPAVQVEEKIMIKDLFSQFSGLLGSAFAAACCLGLPLALSALGALGLGFLAQDAYLMPLFAAFVTFTLWQLYKSAQRKSYLPPYWLGLSAAVVSLVSMWLTVTGLYPVTALIIISLFALVAASLWDIIAARRKYRAEEVCAVDEIADEMISPQRRKVNGAALAVVSAGVFYGLYASVDAMAPAAGENDIKCWGGNSCKGKSACGSALNACTGQNSCKGKGWKFMPEKACFANGGVKFEGSPGDPNRS
jgi:mercuric ion transport protein